MKNVAICLLVVNKIVELPSIAINSIQETSHAPIYVGYLKEEDLGELKNRENLNFVNLNDYWEEKLGDSDYQEFNSESFLKLVVLKWALLLKLLSMQYQLVIYSDLDVIWSSDVAHDLLQSHLKQRNIKIMIQSMTETMLDPKLCMGIVSIWNCETTFDFIKECQQRHQKLTDEGRYIGDDDVITSLYHELDFPNWIAELPQSTYPVGKFANLYARREIFPGLRQKTPMIFHANYVVGLRNKRLLLRIISKELGLENGIDLSLSWKFILFAKRLRLILGRIRRN